MWNTFNELLGADYEDNKDNEDDGILVPDNSANIERVIFGGGNKKESIEKDNNKVNKKTPTDRIKGRAVSNERYNNRDDGR